MNFWFGFLLLLMAKIAFYKYIKVLLMLYKQHHHHHRHHHHLCPVSWVCRIHQLLLCREVRLPPLLSVLWPSWQGLQNTPTVSLHRGKTPPHKECPVYDTKQSDSKVPVILELWGMQNTPSLPLLPGLLWPKVVAPDKGPIYGLSRTKLCFFYYTDFCI